MYGREKKRKKMSDLGDHGSVFNLIRDGSLVVEGISRGPADCKLYSKLVSIIFTINDSVIIRPPFYSQHEMNRIRSQGSPKCAVEGPSTGQW